MMSAAKTAEPTEKRFGLWTHVGQGTVYQIRPRSPYVRVSVRTKWEAHCKVEGSSAVSRTKTAELIDTTIRIRTRVVTMKLSDQ